MSREVARGIARNTTVMAAQHVLTMASSLLVTFVLPRYLGPVEYGWLFLSWSVVAIAAVVVEYGGNLLIVKAIALDKSATAQIVVNSVAFRLFQAVLCIGAIAAFLALAGYPPEVRTIVLIYSMSLLWKGTITSLYAAFQGHEMMQYTSLASIAERVIGAGMILAGVALGASVFQLAVLFALSSLLQAGTLAFFARRVMTTLPRIQWRPAFGQLSAGAPYFLFVVFSTVYYRVDTILLSRMAPAEVMGWYGAAHRLFESLNFPYILSVAVYPVLTRLREADETTHRRTLLKSLELVIMGGGAVTAVIIALADPIVAFLFGREGFAPTVLLLQILVAGLIFLYVDMILGTALLASDRQRSQALVSLSAIPFTAGLNLLLIPWFQRAHGNGAIGSAIAIGCTEVLLMLTFLLLLPRGSLRGFRTAVPLKSLVAGVASAGLMVASTAAGLPWYLAAVAGLGAYGGLLVGLRTFEPADVQFLRSIFASRFSRGASTREGNR